MYMSVPCDIFLRSFLLRVTLNFLKIFLNLVDRLGYFFFPGPSVTLRTRRLRPEVLSRTFYIPFLKEYSGTFPLGHLYSSNTSIQETQNMVPEKCSHNLCICYLYYGSRKLGFTSIQGTP